MGRADLRYGIIGTGLMGLEHLRNIQALEGARVVAVADPDPGSRAQVAQTTGAEDIAVFADHQQLLASGTCDAVVVATPNMTHADVLIDVLTAGPHVLIEKPLCTTVADCHRVIAAAEGYPKVVWVGLEYRYMPPVARLLTEVGTGTLGRIWMVAIREHRFPFLDKVGNWNRFNRNTGGTLVEKCCHFFDLMNQLTGSTPQRVMASAAQDVNHHDERYGEEAPDIWDNALVIVEYSSGARALLDLCMFAEGSENQEELSVVGDLGKAEAFLPSGELRQGRRDAGRAGVRTEIITDDRVGHEGFHHGASYLEHLAFQDAMVRGAPAGVGLTEGLWSVAMGVAAQRSAEQGSPVEVAEVLAAPPAKRGAAQEGSPRS